MFTPQSRRTRVLHPSNHKSTPSTSTSTSTSTPSSNVNREPFLFGCDENENQDRSYKTVSPLSHSKPYQRDQRSKQLLQLKNPSNLSSPSSASTATHSPSSALTSAPISAPTSSTKHRWTNGNHLNPPRFLHSVSSSPSSSPSAPHNRSVPRYNTSGPSSPNFDSTLSPSLSQTSSTAATQPLEPDPFLSPSPSQTDSVEMKIDEKDKQEEEKEERINQYNHLQTRFANEVRVADAGKEERHHQRIIERQQQQQQQNPLANQSNNFHPPFLSNRPSPPLKHPHHSLHDQPRTGSTESDATTASASSTASVLPHVTASSSATTAASGSGSTSTTASASSPSLSSTAATSTTTTNPVCSACSPSSCTCFYSPDTTHYISQVLTLKPLHLKQCNRLTAKKVPHCKESYTPITKGSPVPFISSSTPRKQKDKQQEQQQPSCEVKPSITASSSSTSSSKVPLFVPTAIISPLCASSPLVDVTSPISPFDDDSQDDSQDYVPPSQPWTEHKEHTNQSPAATTLSARPLHSIVDVPQQQQSPKNDEMEAEDFSLDQLETVPPSQSSSSPHGTSSSVPPPSSTLLQPSSSELSAADLPAFQVRIRSKRAAKSAATQKQLEQNTAQAAPESETNTQAATQVVLSESKNELYQFHESQEKTEDGEEGDNRLELEKDTDHKQNGMNQLQVSLIDLVQPISGRKKRQVDVVSPLKCTLPSPSSTTSSSTRTLRNAKVKPSAAMPISTDAAVSTPSWENPSTQLIHTYGKKTNTATAASAQTDGGSKKRGRVQANGTGKIDAETALAPPTAPNRSSDLNEQWRRTVRRSFEPKPISTQSATQVEVNISDPFAEIENESNVAGQTVQTAIEIEKSTNAEQTLTQAQTQLQSSSHSTSLLKPPPSSICHFPSLPSATDSDLSESGKHLHIVNSNSSQATQQLRTGLQKPRETDKKFRKETEAAELFIDQQEESKTSIASSGQKRRFKRLRKRSELENNNSNSTSPPQPPSSRSSSTPVQAKRKRKAMEEEIISIQATTGNVATEEKRETRSARKAKPGEINKISIDKETQTTVRSNNRRPTPTESQLTVETKQTDTQRRLRSSQVHAQPPANEPLSSDPVSSSTPSLQPAVERINARMQETISSPRSASTTSTASTASTASPDSVAPPMKESLTSQENGLVTAAFDPVDGAPSSSSRSLSRPPSKRRSLRTLVDESPSTPSPSLEHSSKTESRRAVQAEQSIASAVANTAQEMDVPAPRSKRRKKVQPASEIILSPSAPPSSSASTGSRLQFDSSPSLVDEDAFPPPSSYTGRVQINEPSTDQKGSERMKEATGQNENKVDEKTVAVESEVKDVDKKEGSNVFVGFRFLFTGDISSDLFDRVKAHGGEIIQMKAAEKLLMKEYKPLKRTLNPSSSSSSSFSSSPTLCVIADKVRTTVKFLCSVARGLPPLTTAWLDDCMRENHLIVPTQNKTKYQHPLMKLHPSPSSSTPQFIHYPTDLFPSLESRRGLEPLPWHNRVLIGWEICIFTKKWSEVTTQAIAAASETAANGSQSRRSSRAPILPIAPDDHFYQEWTILANTAGANVLTTKQFMLQLENRKANNQSTTTAPSAAANDTSVSSSIKTRGLSSASAARLKQSLSSKPKTSMALGSQRGVKSTNNSSVGRVPRLPARLAIFLESKECESSLPASLRSDATSLHIPILLSNWVITSLAHQRIQPIPTESSQPIE